jgi:putative transposase
MPRFQINRTRGFSQVSRYLRSDLALDALKMALWARGKNAPMASCTIPTGDSVPLLRCSERLAEAGALASFGSGADSYDNALAETVIGHYKTEVIRRRGPNIDDVEFATLEWVDWFNNRRLLVTIGDIPPAENEKLYWTEPGRTDAPGLKELSLH